MYTSRASTVCAAAFLRIFVLLLGRPQGLEAITHKYLSWSIHHRYVPALRVRMPTTRNYNTRQYSHFLVAAGRQTHEGTSRQEEVRRAADKIRSKPLSPKRRCMRYLILGAHRLQHQLGPFPAPRYSQEPRITVHVQVIVDDSRLKSAISKF